MYKHVLKLCICILKVCIIIYKFVLRVFYQKYVNSMEIKLKVSSESGLDINDQLNVDIE